MSSLQEDRVRRLHKQFLDAAEKHPCLHFAAVTPQTRDRFWPFVARNPDLPEEEGTFGLGPIAGDFLPLVKGVDWADFPVKETWLRMDETWWDGAYFGTRVPDHVHGGDNRGPIDYLPLNMAGTSPVGWAGCLVDGIAEFDRLACLAVEQFGVRTSENTDEPAPARRTQADRWLEVVCGMDFVVRDQRSGYLVRRLPADVFTASAQAIETLAAKPPAAPTGQRARDGGKTPNRGRKGKSGKPPLSEAEAATRLKILRDWWQAQQAGVIQKDFCGDNGISVKVLQRYVNWHGTRKSRNTN